MDVADLTAKTPSYPNSPSNSRYIPNLISASKSVTSSSTRKLSVCSLIHFIDISFTPRQSLQPKTTTTRRNIKLKYSSRRFILWTELDKHHLTRLSQSFCPFWRVDHHANFCDKIPSLLRLTNIVPSSYDKIKNTKPPEFPIPPIWQQQNGYRKHIDCQSRPENGHFKAQGNELEILQRSRHPSKSYHREQQRSSKMVTRSRQTRKNNPKNVVRQSPCGQGKVAGSDEWCLQASRKDSDIQFLRHQRKREECDAYDNGSS